MFGLRKKIFGNPLEKLDKALSVAKTQDEKNEAFANAFKEGEAEYMKVAKPVALVIGSVLGGIAIAGAVGAASVAGAGTSLTGIGGAAAAGGSTLLPGFKKVGEEVLKNADEVEHMFDDAGNDNPDEAISNDQIMTYGLIGIGIIILISLIRK